MESYSAIKKEWSTDTCYNMDELWKDAKRKKPDTKGHILCDSICDSYSGYEISRIGKFIETENMFVVSADWGRGKLGVTD